VRGIRNRLIGQIVSQTCALIVASCALLAGSTWASDVRAADQSPDTARLVDTIEKNRSTLTPADLQAARRLNAAGDRAYKRQRYQAAFTAYANSYPNAPTAHVYIMAGDAHWRDVVQYQAQKPPPPAHEGPSCRLDNSHVADDLSADLAQHQAVGPALAARDNDRRFLGSALYRRARESAACLQALAQRYQAEPANSCVDLDRLRRCLGAPLLK
jgi:hypothetical protein